MLKIKKVLMAEVLITGLFVLNIFAEDPTLTLLSEAPSRDDVNRIEKILLRMVNGIQYNQPYWVYMYYYPNSLRPGDQNERELEALKVALNRLFSGFSNRNAAKPYVNMQNTFDFSIARKELRFSTDGNEAWMDLYAGFHMLPGDPSVLTELDPEKVAEMSSSEKEVRSRYRKASLVFKKIEGSWYVVSFAGLTEALAKTVTFYETKVATQPPKEKAKR